MKVRSLLAATATVVAATGGFLLAAPVAAYAAGPACGTTDPLPSTVTDSVSATAPADWWSFSSPTPKIVTMVATSGDPDIQVKTGDCASIVCYPYTVGTEVCHVPAGSFQVGVLYYSGPGGVASYSLSVSSPTCSDGVDNDSDGFTDYPSDAGCESAADMSEGVACSTTSGVKTCVGLSTGALRHTVAGYTASTVPDQTITADVYGYVRQYRFDVAGEVLRVYCVDTVVNRREVSPCRSAGGTVVSTLLTLQPPRVTTYEAEVKPDTVVRICDSELQATVNGAGIAALKLSTVC